MKKVLLIIGVLFLLTGCVNVNKMTQDEVVNNFSLKANNPNVYRTGYKYYLPGQMAVDDSTLYNEVLEDSRYKYYLYVDVVSYYNQVKKEYSFNSKAEYSKSINLDDKFGYLEINLLKNDKYLVEIMYNYAKIEVIVDKSKCNEAVLSAISILKSVEYTDSVIANLLGDDVFNFTEEELDIFNTKGSDGNYLQTITDSSYVSSEEDIPDTDLIN